MARVAPAALCILVLAGCGSAPQPDRPEPRPNPGVAPRPEALSLLGEPLYAPALAPERQYALQVQLDSAMQARRAAPGSADAVIWVGRRLAYLGRYRDAIDVFSEGIRAHPDDARLYRHRGHRYITTRQLESAVADLERAAELIRGRPDEVEPDGQPNALGIPTSTLHGNVYYHLALAHYLRNDFARALPVWLQAREAATNDDMLVAVSDWLYMTYRRLGREVEARAVLEPIRADMRIIENDAYHRRLLMYRGELPPDSLLAVDDGDPVQLATYGYGVANWYLYSGDTARARTLFRRILQNPNWAAFGYIAAEADLQRLR